MQSGLPTTSSLSFQTAVADAAWDRWLACQPAAHVLQLSSWRRLKEQFGWRGAAVAGFGEAGQLANGSQLLLKRAAGLTLAYAPRGPVTDWCNRFETELLLQSIHTYARSLGAAVLKIEPDLPDSLANRQLLRAYGFVPSRQTVQPPSTIVLDISGAEADVLARMKSKWRYNVRLAERKGVRVRAMRRADLPAFHSLMQSTGARDGFGIHSADYFAAAFDLLTPQHAVFLLAEWEEQPLGAVVVAAVGGAACYLWGASSDRERSRMPNYALQWAGMQWARAQGATRYDFWGIPDVVGQLAAAMRSGDGSGTPADALPIDLDALPPGELWGVYRFKQGFGGDVLRTVGAWDMALDPLGFRLYQLGVDSRQWLAAAPWQAAAHPQHNAAPSAPEPVADTSAAAEVQTVATAEEWRGLLAQLPDPHVLQSWEWGAVKAQTGWQARRYRVTSPAGSGAFQLLWRQPISALPLRVAYVPKGPLLDWGELDMVDIMLDAVEREARRLGCIYVKVDPDVRDDTTAGLMVLHSLQRRGWRFSRDQVQFKNTAYSELPENASGEGAAAEGLLLAQMKQKWRYNIRLAEKRGVRVRVGGEQDFAAFYALYGETGARDGFLVRPFAYYAQTWRTFLEAQQVADNPAGGVLLLAEYPQTGHPETGQPDAGLPVAGLLLLRYGRRTWYFYGASSERNRRDMPNYLLQWEALRWALAQGCRVYDWWGAPSAPDNPDDAMQGVWQFKQGFGAQLQPHIGAWDYPVSPLLYRLYQEAMPAVLGWMRSRH